MGSIKTLAIGDGFKVLPFSPTQGESRETTEIRNPLITRFAPLATSTHS